MKYELTTDNEVLIIVDGKEIDKVGPWDSVEGATIWAEAVCDKYNSNPTFVYPGEEPVVE